MPQISTHTSLAGRDDELSQALKELQISTHTSLAGRDQAQYVQAPLDTISTHTSLAGRDRPGAGESKTADDFYSHVPRGT